MISKKQQKILIEYFENEEKELKKNKKSTEKIINELELLKMELAEM